MNLRYIPLACMADDDLNLSNLDTSSAINMSGMFRLLLKVNLSYKFNATKVTDMTKMFYHA